MLGTLVTLGLGAYLFGDALLTNSRNNEERERARAAGKKIYLGKGPRYYAVDNGEPCHLSYDSIHKIYIGDRTGRVVADLHQEEIDKMNDELKRKGKEYYYKEFRFLNWNNQRATLYPVDKWNNKPFKINICPKYSCDQYQGWCTLEMEYLDDDPDSYPLKHCYRQLRDFCRGPEPFKERKKHTRELSWEEAIYYTKPNFEGDVVDLKEKATDYCDKFGHINAMALFPHVYCF